MKRVALKRVQVKDATWQNAMEKNLQFIKNMDPERALAGFRKTAGIKTEADTYHGWEAMLIGGHGIGHYFSALGMEIACGHQELRERAEYLVKSLKECQNALGCGYLSAANLQDEKDIYVQFEILEGTKEGNTWVPWYATHKVMQGLLDLYTYGEIKGALEVASSLGDWIADRVLAWDEETRKKVLSTEYGGMNDCLYQLYQLTGVENHKKAAEQFDEPELYKHFLGMANRLRGVHANTTIPKFLGYFQGNPQERVEIADRFWQLVIGKQTYATGGIGDMEHFFGDGQLDGSRTQCNAESCCTYNMIKYSQLLFETTKDPQYLTYIEQALWNARLASMGPKGGYSYFNPMATGYYRLYSPEKPEQNAFWCCVGTGMEDFAKVGEHIFCEEGDELYVNQWISADLSLTDGEKLYLDVDYEKGRLQLLSTRDVKVKLRMPSWIENRGEYLPYGQDYLDVDLKAGEQAHVDFTMALSMHSLPDAENAVGFTYGPFVLCVPLGNEKWGQTVGAGIDVVAPSWKVVFDAAVKNDVVYGRTQKGILDREYLSLPKGETLESFKHKFKDYVEKDGGKLCLVGLSNCKKEEVALPLIPYYQTGDERYGIYWYLQ